MFQCIHRSGETEPDFLMIGTDSGDSNFDYVLRRVAHSARLQLVLVKKVKFMLPQPQTRRRLTSLFDRGVRFERNRLFKKNGEFLYMI